jgi:hypothetical protein
MHKIIIKLFAEQDTFAPAEFVPIFHQWIQTQALADHLLIDVADYAHVAAGPGTLVVASEANIHMDRGGNRLGLMYVRKLPIAGATNFRDTLAGVLRYARAAAELMENQPSLAGRLKFCKDDIEIRFNDRLHTPNTKEQFLSLAPDIEAAVDAVVGHGLSITAKDLGTEKLLTVQATAPIATP